MKIEVKGSSEKPYIVDTEELTCTCPNWRFKCRHFTPDSDGRLCKHLVQVFDEHPELKPYILKKKDQIERQSQLESGGIVRYPRAIFDIYANFINTLFETNSMMITDHKICGEYTRMLDMVDKLDVVFSMKESNSSDAIFNLLELNGTVIKVRRTENEATYLEDGMIEVNYVSVPVNQFAFECLFRNGPTSEILRLKEKTRAKGYELTNKGLKTPDGNYEVFDLRSEESIYNWLGIPFKYPWDR